MNLKRVIWVGFALLGWALVYVFQEFDFTRMAFMPGQYGLGHIPEGEAWRFAINKSARFILNDIFSLLFIYGLFNKRSYLIIALVVMGFGALVLLPTYLILAISFGGQEPSFLVFLHRITMNPWLTLVLVPGFYYQNKVKGG